MSDQTPFYNNPQFWVSIVIGIISAYVALLVKSIQKIITRLEKNDDNLFAKVNHHGEEIEGIKSAMREREKLCNDRHKRT